MTEADWLASDDPALMLAFLRDRGGASERKLRLFAVACCRRVWYLNLHKRSRDAVEAAERFADGLAGREELRDAYREALSDASGPGDDLDCERAAAAYTAGADEFVARVPTIVLRAAAFDVYGDPRHWQAPLLRCVFGNPYRRAPSLPPSVLAWNAGTVSKLAAALYEERAFDRLPVLADALEDAGCGDVDILGHCRSGGEHVRGCWVVDSVLGKG